MVKKKFADFDFSGFWDDDVYSITEYVEDFPSDEIILSIEQELGYKLPASYIELMKLHNGGTPNLTCFPTTQSTSWADDHIEISGIMGIGRDKNYSICGSLGSRFKIEEWGYPNTGIYICNCPSAGHDMVMLDYENCGKQGEPEVVHIDQELDYKKTFLAKDFETFIRGLVSSDIYDTSEDELIDILEKISVGNFSNTLQLFFKKDTSINFEKILRNLLTEICNQKGYFGLHGDELSYLAYDIQFYLLSINKSIKSKKEFAKEYPLMIAISKSEISTNGYADFFLDWFDLRIESNQIVKKLFGGYKFNVDYKKEFFNKIKPFEK